MLSTLERFESHKNSEKDEMKTEINKWVSENSIAKYKILIVKATNKKFPIYFVNHI